jgi:hypothetical protein
MLLQVQWLSRCLDHSIPIPIYISYGGQGKPGHPFDAVIGYLYKFKGIAQQESLYAGRIEVFIFVSESF